MAPSHTTIVGDIGGTNARFALASPGGGLGARVTLPVKDYAKPEDALAHALEHFKQDNPQSIRLAVAGPVTDGVAQLTNAPWRFDANTIAARFGATEILLRNDLQALALSLPHLTADELKKIGPTLPVETTAPMAVMGVGTGLGTSCLVHEMDGPATVIAAEGGHATLAATNEVEQEIIAKLREQFGHVSAERVVSGPGLATLYEAMTGRKAGSPQEIIAAQQADDADATWVLRQFCAFMGAVAGNLALIYGAKGGFFLGGGMPPRIADVLEKSDFRTRFEEKGRFRKYLETIPTSIVLRDDAALIGMANL